jgi:hypothetical protein
MVPLFIAIAVNLSSPLDNPLLLLFERRLVIF